MRLVTWPTPIPAPSIFEPLEATFPSRRAFLEQVQIAPDHHRLFWRCTPHLTSGTRVLLRIRFAGESQCFEAPGQVIQAREDLRGPARSGLVIEVRGPGMLQFARAYAVARGNPPEFGSRAEERFAVDLPGTLSIGEHRQPVRIRDISKGGAFVEATGAEVLQGAVIGLAVRLGLFRRFESTVRVAWQGRRRQLRGFGVEFLDVSDRNLKLLLNLLAQHR